MSLVKTHIQSNKIKIKKKKYLPISNKKLIDYQLVIFFIKYIFKKSACFFRLFFEETNQKISNRIFFLRTLNRKCIFSIF